MKKILVACGSEISPSTMVAKRVGTLCKEKGISCATVQCTSQEALSKARTLRPDLIIGSLDSMGELDVPVFPGEPFIQGMEGMDLEELFAVLGR